ncbi:hypothetical protein [Nocardioides euryhalodurans]|uniref:DUF998 domain-containing protein n=1 Tax=Nocardioides euryhalodurans TaxID=2518370 RepID=A0A4P7GQA1_9ACTN|nr:hypothetical protein [Nocardioides euryhalodurans]QBR94007.1 hypothetical protein EXE57_18250 [Nocardioides euryhalodurans]
MKLAPHHRLALAGAVLTSAIALTDAVTHGLTGGWSPFSEESEATTMVVVGCLVHGLTYAALALVLVREAPAFAATNRIARATRWVLLPSLVTLALGFLTAVPAMTAYHVTSGVVYDVSGLVATFAFLGLILGALVLGLAALRTRALGTGGQVLALMLPVLGVTVLLQVLAPLWAHPAYLETTLQLGLALVGVGATAPATTGRSVLPSQVG